MAAINEAGKRYALSETLAICEHLLVSGNQIMIGGQVDGRRVWRGEIVAETNGHVVQFVGKGVYVVHDREQMKRVGLFNELQFAGAGVSAVGTALLVCQQDREITVVKSQREVDRGMVRD